MITNNCTHAKELLWHNTGRTIELITVDPWIRNFSCCDFEVKIKSYTTLVDEFHTYYKKMLSSQMATLKTEQNNVNNLILISA